MIECVGTCVLCLAHGCELRGCDVYLHIVKKKKNISGNVSLNSARVHTVLFGIFLFLKKMGRGGGSVDQIIYREYIVSQGSDISCGLAYNGAKLGSHAGAQTTVLS